VRGYNTIRGKPRNWVHGWIWSIESSLPIKILKSQECIVLCHSDESRLDRLVFHEDYLSRECG